jgi:large subunit ribosomal protein L32
MAVPKRRQSLSRQKRRRGANRWKAPQLSTCGSCGAAKPGHVACPSCGYYGDRQVLDIEAKG